MQEITLCASGRNWGDAVVDNESLQFSVGSKPLFNVALPDVTQARLGGACDEIRDWRRKEDFECSWEGKRRSIIRDDVTFAAMQAQRPAVVCAACTCKMLRFAKCAAMHSRRCWACSACCQHSAGIDCTRLSSLRHDS